MPATLKELQIEFPHIIEPALFQNRSADKRIRRARSVATRILLGSRPKTTAAVAAVS